jgi:predicted RNA-binding protein
VCLATVYVEIAGQREEVMRDVTWVEPTSSGLRLVTLFGESRLLQAELVSVDLLHSSIVLHRTAAELSQSASADCRDREGAASV